MKIYIGDSLKKMRTYIKDNSIDALITDPPAFLMNGGQDGFMGKEWDGTRHLWRYLWESDTFVNFVINLLQDISQESSVRENAGKTTVKKKEVAKSVKQSSLLAEQIKKDFVQKVVITRRELLALLKAENIKCEKIKEAVKDLNARFVIPLSLIAQTQNTVLKRATRLPKAESGKAKTTHLTLMDALKIRNHFAVGIGQKSASESINEIIGLANCVERSAGVKIKYNAITSFHTDKAETIKWITLLLFAYFATQKQKGAQNYLINNFFKLIFQEAYRVMKPGAHGFVWALPRTSHWTATALEDAGFEIRDVVVHITGQGFPKSHNVGLSIDKLQGCPNRGHRIATASRHHPDGTYEPNGEKLPAYEGKTEDGKKWKGWGTALKPANERWIMITKPREKQCEEYQNTQSDIILVRKPFKGTVAQCVLKHGTGAINIDSCRVWYVSDYDKKHQYDICKGSGTFFGGKGESKSSDKQPQGRFPANVVLSCSCENLKTVEDKRSAGKRTKTFGKDAVPISGGEGSPDFGEKKCMVVVGHQPDCVCAELDAQSGESKSTKAGIHKRDGNTNIYKGNSLLESKTKHTGTVEYGDQGGASRFFKQIKDAPPRFIYKPKVSNKERHIGFTKDEIEKTGGNLHPTLKSIGLMTYLITLITPPNGVVLDPFMGSGTTGMAAKKLGYKFVGIEKEKEYVKIAKKRIKAIRKPK